MKSRALQTAAGCRLHGSPTSKGQTRPDKARQGQYLHHPWHCTFTALLPTGFSALDSHLSTLDARCSRDRISQQPRPAVQTFPPAM